MLESGILNVNKPIGWSSAKVVAHIKRILKVKKAGHCGTLDPRATGVLIICFGKATKLSQKIMDSKKIYRGVFKLGIKTDTGDLDGKIISQQDAGSISEEQVEAVCRKMTGKINQIPPMYSAVKIHGKKLYEIARSGITIERPPRQVEIYNLDLLNKTLPDVEFRVHCSKGTYIRSLVEDIGQKLSCCAVLTSLEREASGDFILNNAVPWEDLQTMNQEQLLANAVLCEQMD